jgi:hypothetical protein
MRSFVHSRTERATSPEMCGHELPIQAVLGLVEPRGQLPTSHSRVRGPTSRLRISTGSCPSESRVSVASSASIIRPKRTAVRSCSSRSSSSQPCAVSGGDLPDPGRGLLLVQRVSPGYRTPKTARMPSLPLPSNWPSQRQTPQHTPECAAPGKARHRLEMSHAQRCRGPHARRPGSRPTGRGVPRRASPPPERNAPAQLGGRPDGLVRTRHAPSAH